MILQFKKINDMLRYSTEMLIFPKERMAATSARYTFFFFGAKKWNMSVE